MNYIDLVEIVNNKELKFGEIYVIDDYPSFPIYLTAIKSDKFDILGYYYLDGIKNSIVYHIDNSSKLFNYKSEYGYVSMMMDVQNNITTTFDFINYGKFDGDLHDITIDTWYNNQYHIPELSLTNCNNIIIHGNCDGVIEQSDNVTIGENNSGFEIIRSSGITIGSNNKLIQCIDKINIQVSDNNEDIKLDNFSVIGSNNKYIKLNGMATTVKNNCIDITITGYNDIDNSKYVKIEGDSQFNKIVDSTCIDITDSYTNELDSSKIININKTNNNKIFTTSLELDNKDSFKRYYSLDSTRLVSDVNEHLFKRADCQATTVNVMKNNIPDVQVSKEEYYITNKVWETIPNAKFTKCNIEVIPNSKDDYTVVTGGGEYTYGDRVRLYANVYNKDRYFLRWEVLDIETEQVLESITQNPYIFTITDNMKVFAVITDKKENV